MDVEWVTDALTVTDVLVAASLVCVLLVAAWLWLRQRRVDRRLRNLRSFGRDDSAWVLREALHLAERLPRLGVREEHMVHGTREGRKR